jgi:hypothetical protein
MKNLFLLFLTITLANSANSQWISNGPEGQEISGLAIGDYEVYASSFFNGVFVLRNSADSWAAVDGGLPEVAWLNTVAARGLNVYTGTIGGGAFISLDTARNWASANNGLMRRSVYSFAFNGTNLFAGTDSGVFLSTNNGQRWIAMDSGLTITTVYSIAISDNVLFAGTEFGLYSSNNNGVSWTATRLSEIVVSSIVVSGANIFVGTSNAHGAYLSSDTGNTWTPINTGLPQQANVLSFAINDSAIFAAASGLNADNSGVEGGIYQSTNNGANWLQVNTGTSYTNYTNVLLIGGSTLYAGTDSGGVWQSPLSQITTGIPQVTPALQIDFKLYPNPVNSNFIIETSATEPQLLQVFDLTGKLVLQQNISGKNASINARNLASGMYAVCLKSSFGVSIQKMIVAK